MEHLPITLTEFDKIILKEYCNLAEGLGDYLGECYELVIHSFASFDHSVIKIVHSLSLIHIFNTDTEAAPVRVALEVI